ncbi:hypothetical protein RAA17_15470 [Komagataeibacter rhaeticus]|nr:hypothetical protein [Komagataeibacter rhaeticus]
MVVKSVLSALQVRCTAHEALFVTNASLYSIDWPFSPRDGNHDQGCGLCGIEVVDIETLFGKPDIQSTPAFSEYPVNFAIRGAA